MTTKKIAAIMLYIMSTSLVTNTLFAEDVQIIGSNPQQLKIHNPALKSRSTSAAEPVKVVQLLKVKLSDEMKQLLAARSKEKQHTHQVSFKTSNDTTSLPEQVQLEMNNVPVLDQGIHGTCVTFAITGAIDAELGKGDYVSQLCSLQLGTYLEKHGYGISGWDGSYGTSVINQMEQYGIINMNNQRKTGCGGLTKYPTRSAHNGQLFMEPEAYKNMSELIFGKYINWYSIYQKNDMDQTLNEVKQALNEKNRLVFGVLLPRTDLGEAGAVGRHRNWFYEDTWVLTKDVLRGVNSIESGHEMIITGYDDNAVAVDDYGNKHKGLLTLRNSWGDDAGHYGDFYMSYDYFKLLVDDVQKFAPTGIQ